MSQVQAGANFQNATLFSVKPFIDISAWMFVTNKKTNSRSPLCLKSDLKRDNKLALG